jgi:hypothetical protein
VAYEEKRKREREIVGIKKASKGFLIKVFFLLGFFYNGLIQ